MIILDGRNTEVEVPTSGEIRRILERMHDLLGHPGINTTYNSVQQRFSWKGMYASMEDYVSGYYVIYSYHDVYKF